MSMPADVAAAVLGILSLPFVCCCRRTRRGVPCGVSVVWAALLLCLRVTVAVLAALLVRLPGVRWLLWRGRARPAPLPAVGGAHSPRVAVVGGGIAGFGAAYTLARSGYQVTVFEARPEVGGNAKTFRWPDGATTGLSVLAWPPMYFRNYATLLSQLGVGSTDVELPFCVRNLKGEDFFHGHTTGGLATTHSASIRRWRRLVAFVRAVNSFFTRTLGGCKEPSMYAYSVLNPMNFIPLRTLSMVFGISRAFWRDVVVPLYASSFLTIRLNAVPAVILPIVDDLIALDPASPPRMRSWTTNSGDVFAAMSRRDTLEVLTNSPVESVRMVPTTGTWEVTTTTPAVRSSWPDDPDGSPAGDTTPATRSIHAGFHRVVMATNATHALRAIRAGEGGSLAARLRWAAESLMLSAVEYTNEADTSFVKGIIHSDTRVLPANRREELLATSANYIEARSKPDGTVAFANTFILSSWYPAVQLSGSRTARFVTYDSPNPGAIANQVGEVENVNNHPHLSVPGLAAARLLSLVQGRHGLYFCGSFATPGNGHDLSLCSGIAAAMAMGAAYPFGALGARTAETETKRTPEDRGTAPELNEESLAAARRDFERLRALMGFA